MPPAYEVLLLNTAVPQIQAAQSGDTYVVPRDIAFSAALTLSAGTANGVPYLNGSKVLTTGSALTFDGTNLGVNSPILAARTLSVKGRAAFTATANDSQLTIFSDGSTNGLYSTYNTTGSYLPMTFWINDAEQMRLTSKALMVGYTDDSGFSGQYNAAFSGNVGIGTSSPANKLDVVDSSSRILTRSTGTATNADVRYTASNADWVVGVNSVSGVGEFTWYSVTANAERMRLDASGNLGLGVTPSAWTSASRVLQIGGATNNRLAFNGTVNTVSSNAYWDTTNNRWEYIGTGNAVVYVQDTGSHVWLTASSGTADNPITFSQAMTLDASGNLLVGDTTSIGKLSVWSASNGDVLAAFRCKGIGTQRGLYIVGDNSTGVLDLDVTGAAGGSLAIKTGGAERARIKSTGQFRFVPLAADPAGAEAGDVYYNSGTNKLRLYDGTSWVDLN